jgi:hypothetical protein
MIAVLLTLIVAIPVLGIADPDSAPEINSVYVYYDLVETGDIGVLIDYNIPYAALPTEIASESYFAVFVDTDGTTQLRAVAPYPFNDGGYNRGAVWIYFSAADVTAFGINSGDQALYRVWLTGNPTLSWVPGPDPPKTIAGIDYWQPADSDTSTLLTLRVLYLASILEAAWSEDMVAHYGVSGTRLTSTGAAYFVSVIPSLLTVAPNAFSTGTVEPDLEDIDYTTRFGATMTNGTGTVTGSPITLVEGANTVTVTVVGTFILELEHGTVGTVANGTGTVTGSPVTIVAGTNTITVPGGGAGTLIVTVNLQDTVTGIEDTVIGTGLDLTAAATEFGMTRWMFSGLVWMLVTVVICAAVVRIDSKLRATGTGAAGMVKPLMIVFDICIVGGAVLGLIHPIVAALLFIGFGGFTGYVFFFRGASI